MQRASEADVVGIDVIVLHQHMARMSYVSSLAFLIVTSHEPGE